VEPAPAVGDVPGTVAPAPGASTGTLASAAVMTGHDLATVTVAGAAASERVEVPLLARAALVLTCGFTVVLGIWPAPLFAFMHAARLLF
jgi:hypothetical protein